MTRLRSWQDTKAGRKFDGYYCAVRIFINDVKQIALIYFHKEEAVKWAYAFLMHRSFVFETGNDEVDSLLFPMEKVFESFIGRLFARCLRESGRYNQGYRISLQGYRTLFDDPKEFRIKPDIRIYKDDTSIIFDTKWKKQGKAISISAYRKATCIRCMPMPRCSIRTTSI